MNLKDRVLKTRLRLQKSNPFFAVLLMSSEYVVTTHIPTMATDGHRILINEEFSESLSDDQFTSVILHETLHMALCHVSRGRKLKDKFIANIAADIIVNGILIDNNFILPEGCVSDPTLKHLSYHEIYKILMEKKEELQKKYPNLGMCLQEDNEDGEDSSALAGGKELEQKWKETLKQAEVLAKSKNYSPEGSGIKRLLGEISSPQINWRDYLYRFMNQYLFDFRVFDRRFLYQGIYLDDLGGEEVEIDVYIDTSGSINEEEFNEFMSELKGALRSMDRVVSNLYFFDTRLYPQGQIDLYSDNIEPIGYGGTSYVPMVRNLKDSPTRLAICFTDGYANHDISPPDCPFLWAVSKGGADNSQFTWGEIIRLGED